jgi:hypothetical protein
LRRDQYLEKIIPEYMVNIEVAERLPEVFLHKLDEIDWKLVSPLTINILVNQFEKYKFLLPLRKVDCNDKEKTS